MEHFSNGNEDFLSGISFWSACDNLATATENGVERLTEEIDVPRWEIDDLDQQKRLNSEGEESVKLTDLDEDYLTRLQK